MQMRQRDEEKRSKAWVIVMIVSTIIIVALIAFFATRTVYGNPLEGEWISEEKGYHLDIDDDDITVEATIDGQYVEVDLYYTLDKTERIITLKSSTAAYAEAADDTNGNLTASEINEALSEFVASYDYSIEGDTLTLTEREYSEQFTFTKVNK